MEGGCNLARLNASCTKLTQRGLASLCNASDRLRMLDLCYAQYLSSADVVGPMRRHGCRMEMLGLGGFSDLTQPVSAVRLVAVAGVGHDDTFGWGSHVRRARLTPFVIAFGRCSQRCYSTLR